jgi:hypothetical protein
LAHIEIFAQLSFDFDRTNLPPSLAALIEKTAARLVEMNDIEVTLKDGWKPPEKGARGEVVTAAAVKKTDSEPDDTIWLDYDAICPYGPITFKLKERIVSANLFGFQVRLNDCPPFLNDLTRIGQQALMDAATGQGNVAEKIQRAAKYAILRDVIVQTLRLRNLRKAHQLLIAKYTAGMKPEHFEQLVKAADLSLSHITQRSRIIGSIVGLSGYAGFTGYYFLAGGRAALLVNGAPEQMLWALDATLIPLGMIMGIIGSKFIAFYSQNDILRNIVPNEILKRTLPKVGKIMWWNFGGAIAIFTATLAIGIISGADLPAWLLGHTIP